MAKSPTLNIIQDADLTEDDTRSRLLIASISLFGQYGYAGVSTRALADAAGANISAIKYHFGGKAGLYKATLEFATAAIRKKTEPLFEAFYLGIETVGQDRDALIKLVQFLAKGIARNLLTQPDMQPRVALFLREYAMPTEFFPVLYERFPKIIHEAFSRLIAVIEGAHQDDPKVIFRAQILIGQIIVFLVGRPILLRRLNWKEIPPDAITMITEEISQAMIRVLFSPLPSEENAPFASLEK